MTFTRNPPLMIIGAIVLRMSECIERILRHDRVGRLCPFAVVADEIAEVVRTSAARSSRERLKELLRLGVIESGVSYAEILASARDSAKIALSGRGIDECVEVPRAVTLSGSDNLSAVETLT